MPTPLWTLSRKTMAAFDKVARDAFVDGMVAKLSRDFPDQRRELGPDRMLREVEYAIAAAADLQVVASADVAAFLDLWFRGGRNPGRRWPWFPTLLGNKTLSPRVRIELCEKMLAAPG